MRLHEKRQLAAKLRDDAVRILTERPYENKQTGWRDPGDTIEKAMILHALRKPSRVKTREEQRAKKRKLLIKEIEATGISQWDKYDPSNPGSDHVSNFRAAVVMQSYVEVPETALSKLTLFCFHRIVRELYYVSSPTWAAGAARAGTDAPASAFVTGECVRAILSLQYALRQTEKAAEILGQAAVRTPVSANVKYWSDQERKFHKESLRVSLNLLRPQLVVVLQEGEEEPLQQLNRLIDAFKSVPRIDPAEFESKSDAHDTAAQRTASDAVATVVEAIDHISKLELKPTSNPSEVGRKIAGELKKAAEKVGNLLDPASRFASSIIDRELASSSPHLGRDNDAAELVFAATIFGRLSDWNHAKVFSSLELLRKLLNPDGRLLTLSPFDIVTKGYRLYVATLEVTRRVAELAANVELDPDPEFVEKLMRPFFDTRARSQDGSDRGWMTDPSSDRLSEWWVTALAADALESVVQMLDKAINRQLLRNFSVRKPDELNLDLDALFYPDFGLSAKAKVESVAIKLQRMRAHAMDAGTGEDPLFSLILYGPPGTGKTTLIEALAKSANVPLVEITPSDILVGGAEAAERRTRLVFNALSMMTDTIILFDEFDSILKDRGLKKDADSPQTVFEFLTPGLLPKLKKLHDAAKGQRVAYVLATNYVFKLDPAATRHGRFDDKHGIYPPDVISRFGRLTDVVQRWIEEQNKLMDGTKTANAKKTFDDRVKQRLIMVITCTAGAPMDKVARPGWYTAPKGGPKVGAFEFIFRDAGIPLVEDQEMQTLEKEAKYAEELQKDTATKKEGIHTKYWRDWETVDNWDEEFKKSASDWTKANEIIESLAPTKGGAGSL